MGFYNKSVFLEFAEPFTGYPRTAFKLREIDLRDIKAVTCFCFHFLQRMCYSCLKVITFILVHSPPYYNDALAFIIIKDYCEMW